MEPIGSSRTTVIGVSAGTTRGLGAGGFRLADLEVEAETLAELGGEPFGELAEESGVADWSAGFWQPETTNKSASAMRVTRECGRDKGHLQKSGTGRGRTILLEKVSF